MFDNTHIMKDAGAVTATGYAEVDAVAKSVNLGAGLVRLNLILNITVIKCSVADEIYVLH